MTQAVINNLDILNKALCNTNAQKSANTVATVSDEKMSVKFNKILDKSIDKKSSSLDDTKSAKSQGDMSSKTETLKDVLIKATREVNMEKSLDLTLARDITEIINQLKNAICAEIPTEENEEDSSVIYNSEVVDEKTAEENTEDGLKQDIIEFQASAESQPLFEQLLSYIKDLKSESENPLTNTITKEQINTENSKTVDLNTITKQNKPENIEKESDFLQKLDEDMIEELKVQILNSESDTQADDNMNKQESPEEIGIKAMLNHNENKSNIQFEKQINLNSTKQAEITPEKIVEQITKHLDSLKTSSKLNMVLNPESLGKVNLQILNSKDGLSAQFTVMTNDARELLLKGLDGLKEALLTQGVNVDNISIKVSDAKEPYNPDWTEQENSENNNNKEQQKQKQNEREKGLFEKTIAKSLNKENGNI